MLKLLYLRIELDQSKFFCNYGFFAPTHPYDDFCTILKGTIDFENLKLLKNCQTFLSFDFWVRYTGSIPKN